MKLKSWQKEALTLKEDGLKGRQIAKKIGKHHSTVNRFFQKVCEDLDEDNALGETYERLLKSTRTHQRNNTALRRALRESHDKEDLLEIFQETLKEIPQYLESLKNKKRPVIQEKVLERHCNKEGCIVEILFSDLQIGKIGQRYNTGVAKSALKEYGEEVLKIVDNADQRYGVDEIVFASLGDIVEDHLKHGVQSAASTDSPLSKQLADAIKHIWEEVLSPLAETGHSLKVIGVAGNHGSSAHKGMDMFKAGVFTYDYVIYSALKLLCETSYSNVEFILPEGVFASYSIYGNTTIYEHGYFNNSSEKSMRDQMLKRGQQIKKHVEYFRCGDMHHTCSYDSHKIVLNGAFFGVDDQGLEYSGILGFNSTPSQVVMVHTDEKVKGRNSIKEFHNIQLAR